MLYIDIMTIPKIVLPPSGICHITCAVISRPEKESFEHAHAFAEVFWVADGTAFQSLNGNAHKIETGDIFFLRPHVDSHRLFARSGKTATIVNLAFGEDVLAELSERYFPGVDDHWRSVSGERVVLNEVQLRLLHNAISTLGANPNSRLLLDRFMLELFCMVGERLDDPLSGLPKWLAEACREMRTPGNFSQGSSRLAELAGRSHEHTSRALKKHYGLTPGEYVNQLRMEYAASELLLTTRGIADIAFDCGFESLSRFYALFKVKHGVSPRRYRLAHGLAMGLVESRRS